MNRVALLLLVLLATPANAQRRVEVTPYLEIDQTIFADLNNGGDAVTYTTLAAGIDASVQTRRTQGQIAYRYERRFGWSDDSIDGDVHSGLASARTWLLPDTLQLEGGALATRTRTDIRGFAPNPLIGDPANVSQLYSAYLGPTFGKRVGDLDVGAAYRFGYTKVDDESTGFIAGPRLDRFDDAVTHVLTGSVGMRSGPLPFGWTVSGGYSREDASQLDQRFEQAYVRADVVVPLTPTVAAVGGVGFEDIQASRRDPLRDAGGNIVIGGDGRFVVDPASPRRLAYDIDGLIWDVGVLWRPSRRTTAELRIGHRYGGASYTGSLSWQPTRNVAVQAALYDGIQTFGRQIGDALATLPTQFTIARNPFGNFTGGCVFGVADGAGVCLDDALQSIATGVYRTRGVNGVVRYSRGRWNAGAGAGYARRRFYAPLTSTIAPDGLVDQSYYVQGFVARQLDPRSNIDASVYWTLYDPGLDAPDVSGTGATASYYRTFFQGFSGVASLGLFATSIDGFDSSLTASALVGARYQF